jgi:spermidine/putrescine transport system permease protein
MVLGNAIQQQFGASRDWPFGAAITTVALILVIAGIWGYSRIRGDREEELL